MSNGGASEEPTTVVEPNEFEKYNDNIDINSIPIYTRSQLSLYNGQDKSQLYVGIRGYIYDVTENSKSYGPGKSYHKLVGKDVSRLLGLNRLIPTGADNIDNQSSNNHNLQDTTWYTGDFNEKENEIVDKWIIFFRKRYRIVGVVVDHETGTHAVV
ncbi:cytochrome b5-like heme/steroid binding domain-containing protein [Scheffersomyces coipomensis]|uniref:cytochrome b5-like heme/steroid binding domain-containing protein n=1 Tax=Scheffersomyces coipomensis TaxID=1788519 RepID=UPI00315DAC64